MLAGSTFSTLDRMLTMNRVLDEALAGSWNGSNGGRIWVPSLDVVERQDSYQIALEVPGVDPSTIDISFEKNILTVRGEKPHGLDIAKDAEVRTHAAERVILQQMTGHDGPDFSAARRGLMEQYPGRWRNITHIQQWEGGGVPDLWGNSLPEPHTWHHEPDVETMSLVPTALHANVPHEGGASAARGGRTPDQEPPFVTSPL